MEFNSGLSAGCGKLDHVRWDIKIFALVAPYLGFFTIYYCKIQSPVVQSDELNLIWNL
jgi:hypothetical protein